MVGDVSGSPGSSVTRVFAMGAKPRHGATVRSDAGAAVAASAARVAKGTQLPVRSVGRCARRRKAPSCRRQVEVVAAMVQM